MLEEKQKLPSGGKAWGPRQKHSKADCGQELQWWRDAPPSPQGLQPGSPAEPQGCPLSDEDAALFLLLGWNKTLKS